MAAAGGGEGMADFGTPGPPPASVAPQGQPLQQLQNVPTSAPNAMDDSDMAASAIPDLCRLIQDEDQVIVQQAAIMVFQLSRDASTLYVVLMLIFVALLLGVRFVDVPVFLFLLSEKQSSLRGT